MFITYNHDLRISLSLAMTINYQFFKSVLYNLEWYELCCLYNIYITAIQYLVYYYESFHSPLFGVYKSYNNLSIEIAFSYFF